MSFLKHQNLRTIASNLVHSSLCEELCKLGKPLGNVVAILEMNNRRVSKILYLFTIFFLQQMHYLSTFGIKLITGVHEIVHTV